ALTFGSSIILLKLANPCQVVAESSQDHRSVRESFSFRLEDSVRPFQYHQGAIVLGFTIGAKGAVGGENGIDGLVRAQILFYRLQTKFDAVRIVRLGDAIGQHAQAGATRKLALNDVKV